MIVGEGRNCGLMAGLSGLLCRMRLMHTAATATVNRKYVEKLLQELAVISLLIQTSKQRILSDELLANMLQAEDQ